MIHWCVFVFSDSCSWVPCLSWTVKLSAVLLKNPSAPQNYLVFQHFCVLNPFQKWLYDFEIHLFTPRTTEGLIFNYFRRFKRSLMLQKEKPCIKSRGVKTFEQNEDVYMLFLQQKLCCPSVLTGHDSLWGAWSMRTVISWHYRHYSVCIYPWWPWIWGVQVTCRRNREEESSSAVYISLSLSVCLSVARSRECVHLRYNQLYQLPERERFITLFSK